MGVSLSSLSLIETAAQSIGRRNSFWAMGSQLCGFKAKKANKWLARKGYPALNSDWDHSLGPLVSALGFNDYLDVDINEKAKVCLDLTGAIPSTMVGSADFVLDSGTLEHVFDIYKGISGMNQLLSLGGVILHVSPVTWFDHGYVNFNSRFFNDFYQTNDYSLVFETFQIYINNPFYIPGYTPFFPKRFGDFNLPLSKGRKSSVNNVFRKLGKVFRLPRKLCYACAWKKENERTVFQVPQDVGLRFDLVKKILVAGD